MTDIMSRTNAVTFVSKLIQMCRFQLYGYLTYLNVILPFFGPLITVGYKGKSTGLMT
jgi:hypothetical protein